ncbi:MAG: DUF6483 family protein [Eubacterium sp.]|nr:DUF6483 family protein [Eubacterium sp.]MDD7208870.1 DUF6483 family protein [Lachnospiraceae bacterium]MDY5497703.1 DUF6483 family protein [Anaerobutyricum sp.]
MLRNDFDLRLTNELIESYLRIAYGIRPDEFLDSEKGLIEDNVIYPQLKQLIQEGKINDAEDLLYEYASPINPDILKVGLFFYYDLNRLDDDVLEKADFSREEINEGLHELLRIYDQEEFGAIFR